MRVKARTMKAGIYDERKGNSIENSVEKSEKMTRCVDAQQVWCCLYPYRSLEQFRLQEQQANAAIEIAGGIKSLVSHVAKQDVREATRTSYQELLASDLPEDRELGAIMRREYAQKLRKQIS